MSIRPGAEAWSVDASEDVGVVLLHGFTGSPASLRPWAEVIADRGWTVRLPRLPGHGTRWQDMNVTEWHDWYAEARISVKDASARCRRVFVAGLSMGGTLALRIAEEFGEAITGLILVNPAVHTERADRHLLPIVKHLIPSFPGISNDIARPGADEVAYDRTPLKAAHSLTHMWAATRADINKVRQPLLLFRSAQDHVVEPSNARWILTHVSSEDAQEIVLPRSFHVATLDYDADTIFSESFTFMNRLSQ